MYACVCKRKRKQKKRERSSAKKVMNTNLFLGIQEDIGVDICLQFVEIRRQYLRRLLHEEEAHSSLGQEGNRKGVAQRRKNKNAS